MTPGRGRRPGGVDTRAEIIDAARHVFHEQGYAGASIRAIARRAAVDPALVHHYFADKAQLYIESMALPIDPRAVQEAVTTTGFSGERLVERFLAQWEQGPGPGSPAFVALAQAMAASRSVADGMREFVVERVRLQGAPDDDEVTRTARRALVGSQLLGIAWARYVMRMEPVASASRAEVARWVGPTIDRYIAGRLDGGSDDGPDGGSDDGAAGRPDDGAAGRPDDGAAGRPDDGPAQAPIRRRSSRGTGPGHSRRR